MVGSHGPEKWGFDGWGFEGWGPNPEKVGPEGWGPEGVGARRGGGPKGGGPKISRIWPEIVFFVFWPSVCVSSRFLVGVFKIFGGCLLDFGGLSAGPPLLRRSALPRTAGPISGCCVKLRRFWGRRGFTQQPENSKRAHLSAPALQTPPKFHQKNPERGRKERILRREEKKSEILGGPREGRSSGRAVLGGTEHDQTNTHT